MNQRFLTILITAVVAVQSLCTGLTVCMDGGTCHEPAPTPTAAHACCCGHDHCTPPDEDPPPASNHDDCDCTDVVFGEINLFSGGMRSVDLPPMLPLTTIDLVDMVRETNTFALPTSIIPRAGPPPEAAALAWRADHLRPVRLLL